MHLHREVEILKVRPRICRLRWGCLRRRERRDSPRKKRMIVQVTRRASLEVLTADLKTDGEDRVCDNVPFRLANL